MKINISNLTFKTIIGILPIERKKKQKVVVDISFEYNYSNINKEYIDYTKIVKLVKTNMKTNKYELLEEAIFLLKKEIYTNYNIKNLQIKIAKPNILKDCIVSLEN